HFNFYFGVQCLDRHIKSFPKSTQKMANVPETILLIANDLILRGIYMKDKLANHDSIQLPHCALHAGLLEDIALQEDTLAEGHTRSTSLRILPMFRLVGITLGTVLSQLHSVASADMSERTDWLAFDQ